MSKVLFVSPNCSEQKNTLRLPEIEQLRCLQWKS